MAKIKPTTKICKYCATEIPYGAKICPNCRKKQSGIGCLGAIGIAVVVLVIIGALGSGGSSNSSSSKPAVSAGKETPGTKAKNETAAATKAAAEAATEVATEAATEDPIEYTACDVSTMMTDLQKNALKAQESYKGQYLEITGRLSVIDSNGSYFALYPDEYSFIGVRCDIRKNEDLQAKVANMTLGDTVTVRGKCTDVGEVLGYSLAVDDIEGYDDAPAAMDVNVSSDGYITVTADDLVEVMKINALKAQNTFKGQQIEITGKLGTIDSNGKYISLDSSDPYSFTLIQCYIKNDEQKVRIMDLSKGDKITIRGKCKDVGELIGYSIDIESIE